MIPGYGTEGPSWDTPVFAEGQWPLRVAHHHWDFVLRLVDVMRADAISTQEWFEARRILDDMRDPDVATVNDRWREFVVALWRMRDGWVARQMKQRRAARRAA